MNFNNSVAVKREEINCSSDVIKNSGSLEVENFNKGKTIKREVITIDEQVIKNVQLNSLKTTSNPNRKCKMKNEDLPFFCCTRCDYKSKLRAYLLKHLRKKHNERVAPRNCYCFELTCSSCTKNGLIGHVIYEQVPDSPKLMKIYKCAKCTYSSNRNVYLKQHITSKHTPEDQINYLLCNHCPYKAKSKVLLISHLKNTHAKNNKDTKLYKCQECNFRGTSDSGLEKHTFYNHLSRKQLEEFPCDLCQYRAKLQSDLLGHMTVKHVKHERAGKTYYMCSQCDYICCENNDLGRHNAQKHAIEDR